MRLEAWILFYFDHYPMIMMEAIVPVVFEPTCTDRALHPRQFFANNPWPASDLAPHFVVVLEVAD